MMTDEDRKNVRRLSLTLPKPDSVYSGSGAEFQVYKAKDWAKPKWKSSALKQLLLYSRKTYLRYGDRALLDKYDAKASIYLVKVSYMAEGVAIDEWLSVRMV